MFYCEKHNLFALIHGKKPYEKEVYTEQDILQFDVSSDDLEAAKVGATKCVCFPWVRFFLLTGVLFLKLFLQIDYCDEHKIFYKCDGTGLVVLANAQVSKTVCDWWQMEPRAGCRCASSTKKNLQEKNFLSYVLLQQTYCSLCFGAFVCAKSSSD